MNWAAVSDAAPYGNIRRADLRALGVADSTIADRIQAGTWSAPLRGVIRLMGGTPTDDERLDAALRYGGDDAVVSGLVAAARHGMERFRADDRVLLLRPPDTRRQSAAGVVFERSGRMPEPWWRGGFPIAPPERAVIDAARLQLRELDQMRALLAESVQRRFTTTTRLRTELEEGSQRWTRLPRIALGELEAGTRSAPEAWAREIALELEHEGFPPMVWNRTIFSADGQRLITPDGWVDEVAMAWEIESVEFHLGPADQQASYRRRALMRRYDVELVEHRPSQLRHERRQVRDDLWVAYERALRRPRPALIARAPAA